MGSTICNNDANSFLMMMVNLPADIKLKIYQELRLQEMLNLSLVCHYLRSLLHPEFWSTLNAVNLLAEYDALFPSFDISSFALKMRNRNNEKIGKSFKHLVDVILPFCTAENLRELNFCHLKAGIQTPINGVDRESLEMYSENFFACEKLTAIFQERKVFLQNVQTLDISGIRLMDGGIMLRQIGLCMGMNLRVIRLRNSKCWDRINCDEGDDDDDDDCESINCDEGDDDDDDEDDDDEDDDYEIDQDNFDIFLKKCTELRVLDIGGCSSCFVNNSFEHITQKLEKLYAQHTWISDEQLALIAKKCGPHSLQEISFFLREEMDMGILRSMQKNLKKLTYMHISSAHRADRVFYLEKLPQYLDVLVIETAFGFNDLNTLAFLQVPNVQSHALSELTLNGTNATAQELMDIGKLRRLQKLSLRLCPNLNDTVCAHLVKNLPELRKIYLVGCGRVSENGITCFLQLLAAKLRWIEAGEHLTDEFFVDLISRLDQMYNSVKMRPKSSNDSRLVYFVRNIEYIKWKEMRNNGRTEWKDENFYNWQCQQTKTHNLHPFVVFSQEAEIHTFLDNPLCYLTQQ